MTRTCRAWFSPFLIALLVVPLAGCENGNQSGRKFLSMGTAPVGGAFPVVGGAIAEVLNEHRGENLWKVQAKGTKGSQENIRRLAQHDLEIALSNAAITYFAVRGEAGWEKAYDMRAIVTLAPNVGMFIARADSGVRSIADLKGKRVIIGPSGAGFEMFVRPLVEEHGVDWNSMTHLHDTQSGAVDKLGDGSADAAFLGGAVPTGSITQATSTFDVHFVPYDEEVRQRLIEKYDFFHEHVVPAKTYKGMDVDFLGLNVGSMHLITSADQDDELIYQITKKIWENREAIAGKHPAGRAINPKNAIRYTGTEFHAAAIRYYREVGIWPETASDAASAETSTTDPSEPVGVDGGERSNRVEESQGGARE